MYVFFRASVKLDTTCFAGNSIRLRNVLFCSPATHITGMLRWQERKAEVTSSPSI